MKRLSVLALVAALLTGACGTIEYSDVNVIPSNTLYVTLEWPTGAPEDDGDPDWNTSCSNPAAAVGGEDVAGSLAGVITDGAYEMGFGVIHLCAGTYETEDIIEFPNLGSITIEGDGMDETIINGADGDDHALLAMVPAECLPEDEPCPSYFNVLTLKDLTLTNGVGGDEVFDIDVDGDLDREDGIPMLAGGAVTAPLVATERVRFSNNSAPCGGAIALYGWTQLASDGELTAIDDGIDEAEVALAAAEYFSSLISLGSSQITDTEFIENSAAIGGAIGGAPLGAFAGGEEIISCLNAGPLSIVNSTFEGNQAVFEVDTGIFGGGAIATANLFTLQLSLADAGAEEEAILTVFNRDVWLNIAGSTFTDNYADQVGGAVISYGKTSISRTAFTNNSVDPLAPGTAGGAIALVGELSLSYSIFVGNSATSGGAVTLLDTLGGEPVLTRNTFIRNVATDQGGAITGWTDAGSARGNRFTSNRAPVGSAVAVLTERCSRTWSRRAARDWRGNTFHQNRGGRLPVECYVAPAPG